MCGIVTEIGPKVCDLALGELVAVESHIACGGCDECVRGNTHVCKQTRILGIDADGVWTEEVVLPAENCWQVPDIDPVLASCLEPFGNAVHACAAVELDSRTVVVLGCGPIGCFGVAEARVRGARRIVAIDPSSYRRGIARAMGADVTLSETSEFGRIRREARAPIDVVLEMSGGEKAVAAAVQCVRPEGDVVLMGISQGATLLDFNASVVLKSVRLHGVSGRRPEDWKTVLGRLRSKTVDIRPVVTHEFPMSHITQAMALIRSGQCGKITLVPEFNGGTERVLDQ